MVLIKRALLTSQRAAPNMQRLKINKNTEETLAGSYKCLSMATWLKYEAAAHLRTFESTSSCR